MPSPPTCPAAEAEPDAGIASQRATVAELERTLWAGGLNEGLLADYQAAFRRLEACLAERGDDQRHGFVVVIPVADNPRQTRACLDSLLELCRAFGYGGMADGRYRKVRVLLADDSRDADAIAAHRTLAGEFAGLGLAVEYFGQKEQLALLDRVTAGLADGADLSGIIGVHDRRDFSHKGQAMMRNIAYLRFAEIAARDARLLCFTVDGDQEFKVKVATPAGAREVCAVNFFFWLDEIFRADEVRVLTGKVVGDPPVSPAVMAGNFLDDVIGFLNEMAGAEPDAPYRQPALDTRGSGEAAYHDMADLFGFQAAADAYRFHCEFPEAPSNADSFAAFSQRLHSFFHGEHPTRVTWYRHANVPASVQPARTVYTGNYVFRREALDWFIPFAPLRLRMSGPTMGRMLRAEMGAGFVAANLPMLHRRTVRETGASEFRPGIHAKQREIDLCGEFERQFHGDVMLFAMERLSERGFPGQLLAEAEIAATLDAMQAEMGGKYRARHQGIRAKQAVLNALLDDPSRWWNRGEALKGARENFRAFAANLERNFGADSPCLANIESAARRADWRGRQLAALAGFHGDRAAWRRALETLARS